MNILYKAENQIYIVVLLTFFITVSVNANLLQSHSSISHAVKKFVMQQQMPLKNIEISLTSLNKQLALPKCDKALQVKMAPGAKLLGHTSLSVHCASTQKWKIHVAAHVDAQVSALIARHPIPRGTVIQNSDLEFVLRRYSQLNHGYYTSVTLLNNMQAKRNIRPGQILTPGLVKAKKLVLRGEHITIIAQSGALNLRVKGQALMDGKQGQTIRVKNLNSKKLIYARVISAGTVRVNF